MGYYDNHRKLQNSSSRQFYRPYFVFKPFVHSFMYRNSRKLRVFEDWNFRAIIPNRYRHGPWFLVSFFLAVWMGHGFSENQFLKQSHFIWLVIDLPLWKKYELVSSDHEIPNWMESHKNPWFQSPPTSYDLMRCSCFFPWVFHWNLHIFLGKSHFSSAERTSPVAVIWCTPSHTAARVPWISPGAIYRAGDVSTYQ